MQSSFTLPPRYPRAGLSRRALAPQVQPMPLPAQPRGCKGRSPLHKKTKNPPFPGGEGGAGGWGQESKPKVGLAGDKEGTPPAGHFLRRLSQCRFRLSPGDARGEAPCIRKLKTPPSRWEGGWGDGGRQTMVRKAKQVRHGTAPRRATARQGQSARRGDSFKSPPAHPCPLRALAPQVQPMPLPAQPRGCKGQSPLHKKTKNSPFPGGEGGRGDGGRKASQKQGWQATRKARPPPGNGKARSASKEENSFKSPPAHPRPKNAAGARQATGGRRRRTDPPSAEGKAGGREPQCTGHPEAQPHRDPPESG